MSASSNWVTCGMVCQACCTLVAVNLRIRLIGSTEINPHLAKSGDFFPLSLASFFLSAFSSCSSASSCSAYLFTSSAVIRSPGPVPFTMLRSTSFSRANLRTEGDAGRSAESFFLSFLLSSSSSSSSSRGSSDDSFSSDDSSSSSCSFSSSSSSESSGSSSESPTCSSFFADFDFSFFDFLSFEACSSSFLSPSPSSSSSASTSSSPFPSVSMIMITSLTFTSSPSLTLISSTTPA